MCVVANEVSHSKMHELADKAKEILLRADTVDDAKFVYFGKSKDSDFYQMGFDCWAMGDENWQNYMQGALVQAKLEGDSWHFVVVTQLVSGDGFFETLYPRHKDNLEDYVTM